MENANKPQDNGSNSKAMGEIVRYLKNYPFLLITVAGLLILVGILVFDKEKLEMFKVLIYGIVLVPVCLQFFLEFRKWGIQLNTVMLVFQNGIKHTESPACLAKGWD